MRFHATHPLSLLWQLALVAALALTSCDVHEFPVGDQPSPPPPGVPASHILMRFTDLDMPVYTTVEFDTRPGRLSRSSAPVSSRHIIKVYPFTGDDSRALSRTEVATVVLTDEASAATDDRLIDLSLPPGRYNCLAWTDYSLTGSDRDLYYNTSDFAEISLLSEQKDGLLWHEGNTVWRDAFRGSCSFSIGSDGLMYATDATTPLNEAIVEMRRPMARFVFVTTDVDEFISRNDLQAAARNSKASALAGYGIVIRYSGYMPSEFNNFTDKPVNSITGAAFNGLIALTGDGQNTATLGSDYVFVNGRESTVMLSLDVYDNATATRIASTGPIAVPLMRNRLTVVKGKFLTSTAGSDIGINPDFSGDIDIEIH